MEERGSSSSGSSRPQATNSQPPSKPPSGGAVLSSASVLLKSVKSKLKTGRSGIDKHEFAGAACNIIGAVAHYGKLDKTPLGAYAHKAEDYLQHYATLHGKPDANLASNEPSSVQGQSWTTAGQAKPPVGYPPTDHVYSAAAAHDEYSQGHSDPHQRLRPAESHDHAVGYPPQGYPSFEQGQSVPIRPQGGPPLGYPPLGYPRTEQVYRPAASPDHSEPHQRYKLAESQDYPVLYPPQGYPPQQSQSMSSASQGYPHVHPPKGYPQKEQVYHPAASQKYPGAYPSQGYPASEQSNSTPIRYF